MFGRYEATTCRSRTSSKVVASQDAGRNSWMWTRVGARSTFPTFSDKEGSMKISVIGAGNVGSRTRLRSTLAEQRLGEIWQLDIVEGMSAGKALDMAEAGPVGGFESHLHGTQEYEDIVGSEIVVITAGLARKTRDDPDGFVDEECRNRQLRGDQDRKIAPDLIIVVVNHPLLCATTYVAWKTSAFPRGIESSVWRVCSSTCFRYFVASELQVSVEDTQAMVLGGHV